MVSVEPTVWSPRETVQGFVGILVAPAVEENLRFTGLVLGVFRDEQKLRGCANPNTTEADLDAADEVESVDEHGAFVECSVTVGVFKDEDAVLVASVLSFVGVAVCFRNPQAATFIDCKGDGLFYIRFGCNQFGLEAWS